MKINNKFNMILILILGITPIIAYILLYNHLPDKVPVHFNLEGEIDRYGSKLELLIIAVLPLGIGGLFYVIPKIDPKGRNFEKFGGFFEGFKLIMVIFMDMMFILLILTALGYSIFKIEVLVPIMVGCLFIFIGNYMPKAKQNFTFGIRTPWTLSDEKVWNKTHRLGGYSFIIGGIIMVAIGIMPKNSITIILFIIAILICVLFPICMSYMYYKKIK